MSDNTPLLAPPEPEELFPEPVLLRPCTTAVCTNGHTWNPMMALAKCGFNHPDGWHGCESTVLAIKEQLCGVCNEPMDRIVIRVDITGPARFPVPICIPNSHTNAELHQVVIERTSWRELQSQSVQKVEEKNPPEPDTIDPEVKEN